MLLTDLADAARSSGLKVVPIDGWQTNISGGDFDPQGVLVHHTGSFDAVADASDDLSYARWLAFTGRPPTVPPPLCNLALSAECVVYVCSSGNANHAGRANASGPMPAASDGNALYIGIEAMNSGSQGWDSTGLDRDGNRITQRDAYVRLCAALCDWYEWPASHVRGHRETSTTGKWDPGLLDLDDFRRDIHAHMQEDTMTPEQEAKLDKALADLAILKARHRKESVIRRSLVRLVRQGKADRADLTALLEAVEADAEGGDDSPQH